MSTREPSVETSEGYEKFLTSATKAVIREWVKGGGDIPKGEGDQLTQRVISSLEVIFTERR